MVLKGKTAIITGGSSGIGKAIALKFAECGANVIIADISTEPLEGGEPTHLIIQKNVLFVKTDISLWGDIDHLVYQAVKKFGRIDIMVNCAAVFSGTALLDTDEDHWDHVMGVNLKGTFMCCKRIVQQMVTQEIHGEERGRIINLTSQHGIRSAPSSIAYGTSKAGILYMTKQIAYDYAKQHIICNAIGPGKINTGKKGRLSSDEVIQYSIDHTPLPRLGIPTDVAEAALFLSHSPFMTGAVIMVDGGWMTN
jgi:NAD(P)-dependent dehydrogenase (short-subunit alcohol dehydrogenase family)